METTEPRPTHVEMHLSSDPDFTRKGWSRRVVKAGGRYSACRGDSEVRFVQFPIAGNEQLLAELVGRFPTGAMRTKRAGRPCTTIIGSNEGERLPAWVAVQYVENDHADPVGRFVELWRAAYANWVARGKFVA